MSDHNAPQRIVRLDVEQFKRIDALSIGADGQSVTVLGQNGVGKSSALDAIEAALGGARHEPEVAVRRGSKRARVVVETEQLVVTRTFSGRRSQLKVAAKDGSEYRSPQSMLDTMIGAISFDPIAFSRRKPAEQAEVLRKLLGINTGELDRKRSDLYEDRTIERRALKQAEAALEALPLPDAGTPVEPVSTESMLEQLRQARQTNAENASLREKLGRAHEARDRFAQEVEDLKGQLAEAQDKLDRTEGYIAAQTPHVAKLVDVREDAIEAEIAAAQEVSAKAAARKAAVEQRAKQQQERDECAEEVARLSREIEAIDADKRRMLNEARYPIEGLALDDDGLLLDDVPFSQASSAQQLRACVAIGIALNPQLRVLLIRDGSLLDDASYQAVLAMAREAGVQVWIERVSGDGEIAVVFDDGDGDGDADSDEAAA